MAYLLPSMMLTTAGKQLYAKAHNGECAIKFSEIVVGTGYINSADEIPALTGLKNKVNATAGTLSVQTINDSTVCISARITAADSPFYMREIGLMAEDPDEGDILYGYCNFADTADYVEIYNGAIGSTQDIDIYVAVSNTENFSVDITDVVTATPEDVAAAKEELDEKINSEIASRIAADETLDSEKIEDKIVTALPSTQILYNFDDGEPLFTVPSIGETVKGISETVQDTANDGYYQRVCSTGAEGTSATIGSTANVYSQFDFETITANATDVTIEFDFQYVINGRMRLAICDLDTVNALDNSEIRYNTNGIAIDLFSASNSRFQVNSDGGTRSSFFGAWLHGKFIIDFKTKTVDYSIFAENSPSDSMAGTEPFRDSECNRITGIAVYTWLADDTVLFDNIKIVSRINVAQNTRYIIYQNGRYQTYKYIDGEPVLLAGDDLSELAMKMGIIDHDLAIRIITMLIRNLADREDASESEIAQTAADLIAEVTPEIKTMALSNTANYPFNDSAASVSMTKSRNTTNYTVEAVATASDGNVGEIVISDKQKNGFKVAFTGSATSVTVQIKIRGGILA